MMNKHILTILHENPDSLINANPEFWTQNAHVPSPSDETGISTFCQLLQLKEGRTFLYLHPELLKNIPLDAWEKAIPAGREKGKTPLFLLCESDEGLTFLYEHPELLKKIPAKAWGQTATCHHHNGESPLHLLCKSKVGCQILTNFPETLKTISIDAWTQVAGYGSTFEGTAPLFWLCHEENNTGHTFLNTQPELVDKIPPSAWAELAPNDRLPGHTPLYHLCKTSPGINLLLKHPRIFTETPESTWAHVVTTYLEHDTTPVFWLLTKPEGTKLLTSYPELVEKIPVETWTLNATGAICENISPLTMLLTSNLQLGSHLPPLLSRIARRYLNEITPQNLTDNCAAVYEKLQRDSEASRPSYRRSDQIVAPAFALQITYLVIANLYAKLIKPLSPTSLKGKKDTCQLTTEAFFKTFSNIVTSEEFWMLVANFGNLAITIFRSIELQKLRKIQHQEWPFKPMSALFLQAARAKLQLVDPRSCSNHTCIP